MQIEQGTNSLRTKASNQSSILRTIYYYGPILRSEIAQRLDLTLPTITTNVSSMIDAGIVKETSARENQISDYGRHAHPVQIVPENRHFIGVEMTAKRCCISVEDFGGQEIASYDDEDCSSDYELNIKSLCRNIDQVLYGCHLSWEKIDGVCIALPGMVDQKNGILKCHPRNNWNEKNIRTDFRLLTGYQGTVTVENNASVRAFGARVTYRDQLDQVERFAYLFAEKGLACPLFLNRPNCTGSVVGAGEIGHMIMVPNGRKCICGNRGCLETYAGGYEIIAICKELMEQNKARCLRDICGGKQPTLDQIALAQEQGDADVAAVVDEAISMLAIAISNVIHFSSPDILLIEGRLFNVPSNRDRFVNTVKKNLANLSIYLKMNPIFVDPDNASGARGAAAVAIDCSLE